MIRTIPPKDHAKMFPMRPLEAIEREVVCVGHGECTGGFDRMLPGPLILRFRDREAAFCFLTFGVIQLNNGVCLVASTGAGLDLLDEWRVRVGGNLTEQRTIQT